jgi:hypothetical protein
MHRDFVKEMEVTSDALFADEKEQEQMSNLEHEINREVFKNKLLEDTNGLSEFAEASSSLLSVTAWSLIISITIMLQELSWSPRLK